MSAVELGQIVHLSDVTLPTGVESTALALGDDHDLAIAAVIAPRGSKAEDDEDAGQAEGEEPAAEE